MEPWICPRCQTVHAPWVAQCHCPPPTITISGTVTFCTCGQNTTAVCPVHGQRHDQTTCGTNVTCEWHDAMCTRFQ